MSADGFWGRLTGGTRHVWCSIDWLAVAGADWADHIMAMPVTDRHHAKQGRSTGRLVLRNQAGRIVVYLKRHRRLAWWRRALATVWPGHGWTPALAEWRNLQWAKSQGIPVPEPVAAGEFIGPLLHLESFLAIKELTGLLPLHEAIPLAARQLPPEAFRRWKRKIVVEVARLTRLLHQGGHYHKDFYLCHFFTHDALNPNAKQEGQIALIDLHRLGHHPWAGQHWQLKDLGQLLYSSDISGIDDRDRLRFLHLYLDCRKLDRVGRRLRQRVLNKAARYHRHNDKCAKPKTGPEVKAA
jgi:heptose I phosphotransferase